MTPSRPDEELVRCVAHGDEEALIELYQQHGRSVYSLAYYVVHDHALAEEITQDVFVTLWQKADQFDAARGRLAAWLLQITRNLSIDRLRYQRRRRESVSLDAVEVYTMTNDGPITADDPSDWNSLLQKLPAEQRQAIELAYFQGFTHEEIAAKFHLPVGTVKSRILLGLRKLKNWLK